MSAGRILVVDDDPQIRRVMRVTLTGQGYEVDDVKSGEAALESCASAVRSGAARHEHAGHGRARDVPRDARRTPEIAIIMLTVRDSEADKVEALDAGADDYVTKPFNTPELLARIRAALRRSPSTRGRRGHLTLGAVDVDFDARQVTARGRRSASRRRSSTLLRYLAAHANKVVSHRELLQAVWGPDYGDQVDYLRVFVNQLRKKIEASPSSPLPADRALGRLPLLSAAATRAAVLGIPDRRFMTS